MTAVLESDICISKTVILFCALIYAAGCGGGAGGQVRTGGSGSTGFSGGYIRSLKNRKRDCMAVLIITVRRIL